MCSFAVECNREFDDLEKMCLSKMPAREENSLNSRTVHMGYGISLCIISLYSNRKVFNASDAVVSEFTYTFIWYKNGSIKNKSKQNHICHVKGHKITILDST